MPVLLGPLSIAAARKTSNTSSGSSRRPLAARAKTVHALMNNCYQDYGVRNAARLAELLAAT